VKIAAPDIAYVGYKASELERFLPSINDAVDVVAYHMYDSFKEDMNGSIHMLVENSNQVSAIRRESFPKKRLWMTETTGVQWNSDTWHTYGWRPELTEQDKAIKAGRYVHMTLVNAGAHAFLWWGLIYSLAPEKEKNPEVRQKHRDEGLVLVKEQRQANGRQEFLERTKKFYVIKQYANFIKKGYRRVEIPHVPKMQVSAYVSPDRKTVVAVAINDTKVSQSLAIAPPFGITESSAYQTDAQRNCEEVPISSLIPAGAVRTFVFQK
jgi:O-glycosyl hydrolase